ncbi:MAG: hypothetical protein ABMB14_26745 [Myxococcota bacterium]
MKVSLTKAEYRAVNALRGLPEGAHMLIMCSSATETGGVLEGSEGAFEELVSFIGEAMADGMLSATAIRALWALCVKIDPDCADWLGM